MPKNNKISFRLPGKGKRLFIYKKDILLFLITFLLTIISIVLLAKDPHNNIKWALFFPVLMVLQLLFIIFRSPSKYHVEMTTADWNAITEDDRPFEYHEDGFTVNIKDKGASYIAWTDIQQIVAYHKQYYASDEIGLQVYADNGISFIVPELTPGCMAFYKKVQKHLTLAYDSWMSDISQTTPQLIIYQRP